MMMGRLMAQNAPMVNIAVLTSDILLFATRISNRHNPIFIRKETCLKIGRSQNKE